MANAIVLQSMDLVLVEVRQASEFERGLILAYRRVGSGAAPKGSCPTSVMKLTQDARRCAQAV